MKITVVGAGYVGFSLALLLARYHEVTVVDVAADRVAAINEGRSPIADGSVTAALTAGTPLPRATLPHDTVYASADLVLIAAPTNYDHHTNSFDTSQVQEVTAEVLRQNPRCTVVIKSTVPIGFTEEISQQHPGSSILFSPEFLREGSAFTDNLAPSRIIIGVPGGAFQADAAAAVAAPSSAILSQHATSPTAAAAERVLTVFKEAAENDCPALIMHSTEAEAVKLFANTYLALRVAFFNELDTYARSRELDPGSIISGVCLDPRVGNHYNNPSFGYGGYCLPKDTRQLLANYERVPQRLIEAIVESNRTRKDFIADEITKRVLQLVRDGAHKPVVGVYRLSMKSGSLNSRSSSVLGVMRRLRERGITMQVYEPSITAATQLPEPLIADLQEFRATSDIILANRWDAEISDLSDRVFCCDLFGMD